MLLQAWHLRQDGEWQFHHLPIKRSYSFQSRTATGFLFFHGKMKS